MKKYTFKIKAWPQGWRKKVSTPDYASQFSAYQSQIGSTEFPPDMCVDEAWKSFQKNIISTVFKLLIQKEVTDFDFWELSATLLRSYLLKAAELPDSVVRMISIEPCANVKEVSVTTKFVGSTASQLGKLESFHRYNLRILIKDIKEVTGYCNFLAYDGSIVTNTTQKLRQWREHSTAQ